MDRAHLVQQQGLDGVQVAGCGRRQHEHGRLFGRADAKAPVRIRAHRGALLAAQHHDGVLDRLAAPAAHGAGQHQAVRPLLGALRDADAVVHPPAVRLGQAHRVPFLDLAVGVVVVAHAQDAVRAILEPELGATGVGVVARQVEAPPARADALPVHAPVAVGLEGAADVLQVDAPAHELHAIARLLDAQWVVVGAEAVRATEVERRDVRIGERSGRRHDVLLELEVAPPLLDALGGSLLAQLARRQLLAHQPAGQQQHEHEEHEPRPARSGS